MSIPPSSLRSVALISVSIDLGAGRRGVDMGPSALRIAGLTPALQEMGLTVEEIGTVHASDPEVTEEGEGRTKYRSEIMEVCSRARDLVRKGLDRGCLPLVLGGDHSLSIGTVAAVADHFRDRGDAVGVIWVDAHTDMNTPETTPSGNIHGMALSVLTGQAPGVLDAPGDGRPAVSPEKVSILGARKIDEREKEIVRASGIRVYTMSEIDERGIAVCMDEALERATSETAGFHLSFDLDGLDPMIAPGVGTPVAGGITYREAHLVCEKAARSGRLVSLEMVELNPVQDEGNRTAQLGVGLIASALGKKIL